jgi:hypothetical protein
MAISENSLQMAFGMQPCDGCLHAAATQTGLLANCAHRRPANTQGEAEKARAALDAYDGDHDAAEYRLSEVCDEADEALAARVKVKLPTVCPSPPNRRPRRAYMPT